MARTRPAGTHRRIATLFTGAFLVLVVVLALLGNFGLPEALLGAILGGAMLVTFAAIGLNAGTMETSEFHLAGRSVSAAANGMASAAAVMGGAIYLGLAGVTFADAWTGAAFTVGWSLGLAILAVLIAPYFRKSAAFGVADFLGIRYDSRLVRSVAAAAVAAALTAALAAALATASFAAASLFGVAPGTALLVVAVVVACSTVLGGMRAITLSAIVQYIVLAVAFLAPVAIVSAREFSVPLPQLTFGFALEQAALAAGAGGGTLVAALPGRFLPFEAGGPAALFASILCLAAGVAALPHLVVRTATVPRVDDARRSAGWTLLFLLVVALTVPAYAAFAKLTIVRDLVGTGLEMLPDWVFDFGALGQVQICGTDATSAMAAIEACHAGPNFTGNLAASDLAIGGDVLVLAAPAIFDLPFVGSALIAAGALAATIATANAIAFALASAIGHDLYGGVIDIRASAGRRLIVTRVFLLLAIAGGAWLAANRAEDAFALALTAISLSAGGLFPAMVLGVWWKRANAGGAVAGIVVGTLVTAAIAVEHRFPGTLPLGALNPARLGLNELTAAIVGMPLGFLAVVAVGLLSAGPSEEREALVDAIRRPGGTPFVQESES
ncbi:MAG: VC_2705 family sodium/solute symporter [Bauldia sp.]|nr:VC_2705 family sodium/solute symporter [Bauldia sp.]